MEVYEGMKNNFYEAKKYVTSECINFSMSHSHFLGFFSSQAIEAEENVVFIMSAGERNKFLGSKRSRSQM